MIRKERAVGIVYHVLFEPGDSAAVPYVDSASPRTPVTSVCTYVAWQIHDIVVVACLTLISTEEPSQDRPACRRTGYDVWASGEWMQKVTADHWTILFKVIFDFLLWETSAPILTPHKPFVPCRYVVERGPYFTPVIEFRNEFLSSQLEPTLDGLQLTLRLPLLENAAFVERQPLVSPCIDCPLLLEIPFIALDGRMVIHPTTPQGVLQRQA